MKVLLIIVFTFFLTISFGQQIKINDEFVDAIHIKSDVGAYQFDKKGTVKGEEESLIITFDQSLDQYVVQEHFLEKYINQTQTNKTKTKKTPKKYSGPIDTAYLNELINALFSSENTLNILEYLEPREFNKLVNERQIRKVAKMYDIDWQFRMRYTTKEENEEFFKSCQSLDSFKIYLKERFDSTGYMMVTDYSNTINICISTNNSEYRFEGKYPNPIKQPWYNHSNTGQISPKPILNLKINRSLEHILPSDYLLKNSISMQALANDYIDWYFNRREFK